MRSCVLVIDDDANLLSAMRRQFRGKIDIHTAQGGEEALAKVRARKCTPAVVICDMRMAGMNGVQTLAAMREAAPEATRLMLTGNADLKTAVDAINAGHVFRFLTKPCEEAALGAAIDDALDQHRLVTAERALMEETLAGSVQVLTDVLAAVVPEAFSRASRVSGWAQTLAAQGAIAASWQLNLAAMLAPIGLVALPADLLAKRKTHAPLSKREAALLHRAPETARRIIGNIPRLRAVADIVYLQDRGFDGSGFPEDGPAGHAIPAAARLLRILNDLAAVSGDIAPTPEDIAVLCRQPEPYDPDLLAYVHSWLGQHQK
jgi:response regulator RpfG family c-di-GMP phosphodiesterase